jgi:putative FmdB family regulatory protein
MPTYEYVCKNCGHVFEIVQSMSDPALVECPVCGGELRKVFAPPAISFKGSGFYSTDHGKKSSKPSERSSESTKETSGSKPEGGSKTGSKEGQSQGKSEGKSEGKSDGGSTTSSKEAS